MLDSDLIQDVLQEAWEELWEPAPRSVSLRGEPRRKSREDIPVRKRYRVVYEPQSESVRLEPEEEQLEKEFRSLADRWLDETEYISNINKVVEHPAYQQIIGMGKVARDRITTLLLKELERDPDHWLVALHEITGIDPAQPDASFEEAVEAWLNWGRTRGYLTDARP